MSIMKLEQLKALLTIDKNSLDDEISKQPMLYYDIAEACVEASAERDARKEELATVDAELDGKVRMALAKREEKVTEAMVKNAVQTNQEHETAFEAFMKAKTSADLLVAMKDAFGQRGYMLRDLAQLYIASYFEQSSVHNADRARYEVNRDRLTKARAQKAAT